MKIEADETPRVQLTSARLKISALTPNTGQIKGVPKNARFIRDEKYKLLVKSITDDPELLDAQPIIVYEHGGQNVVIAGNMRFRACRDLGFLDVPVAVASPDTPPLKLCAYAIKTNSHYGENDWDELANGWDDLPLADWGVDIPVDWAGVPDFEPDSIENQGRLDQKKPCVCPECGHEFAS